MSVVSVHTAARAAPERRHGAWRPGPGTRGLLGLLVAVLAAVMLAESPFLEHYRRGLELEARGEWLAAAEQLRRATQLDSTPRWLSGPGGSSTPYDPYFHSARCRAELGQAREANRLLEISARAGVTPPGEIAALRARLWGPGRARPLRDDGLHVTSTPPGALVLVDGVRRGHTPLATFPLRPGPHTLRLEAPGHQSWEQRVVAEHRRPLTVDATLTPVPPVPATAPAPTQTIRPRDAVPTAPAAAAQAGSVETPPGTAPPAGVSPPPGIAEELARTDGQPRLRRLLFAPVLAVLLLAGAVGAGVWLLARRRGPPASPTEATVRAASPGPLTAPTAVGATAVVGPFEVEAVLGRGGMATTFRARRIGDGTVVALKLPHESYLSDGSFVARFVREGRLGEQLHHPRIVRILAAGEERGRPYLAMELLPGHTLKREILERGRLPLRRAVEIASDIAEALDYAHLKGVVHRDLKPENVMLLPDGSVKVMDFGIARVADQPGLTASNLFLGTPLYAAPEMVDPRGIDHRVDLYALGIMLFEMTQGQVPFLADSPYRALEMHVHQPLPGLAEVPHPVPPAVWAVIARLCEKDRERRHPSAEALLVELGALLQTLPAGPGRPAPAR